MNQQPSTFLYFAAMIKLLSFLSTFLFALSAHAQITWDTPIDVAPQGNGKQHPGIVTDADGDPMVIWYFSGKTMFARWTGSGFESPRAISPINLPVAGASWMGPDIAAKGDTVYVVFKETPEHEGNSWLMSSFDGGETFNEPVQVDSITNALSRFPTVTIDDEGNPIVAFMKFNESFGDARWVVSKSYDAGITFSPDVLASGWSSPESDVCDCCPGSIISSGDVVAMVYRDNNNNLRDSWAGLSYDGGETFAEGTNIDRHNWMVSACPASGPEGVIIGDTLYSTFMNSATGKSLVYFGRMPINDIQSAASDPVLSNNAGVTLQNYPRIDAYGKALGVVWKQFSGSKERILLRLTEDVTEGFLHATDTVDVDNIENVDIALHDGKVYVVWEDYGSGTVKFRSGEFSSVTSVESEVVNKSIHTFPNPSSDGWTISGDFNAGTFIRLYNSNGEIITQQTIVQHTTSFDMDNCNLINGVYFLQLFDKDSQYSVKLLK